MIFLKSNVSVNMNVGEKEKEMMSRTTRVPTFIRSDISATYRRATTYYENPEVDKLTNSTITIAHSGNYNAILICIHGGPPLLAGTVSPRQRIW